MDVLNEIFPIILYFLGAVLLIVVIILITRLISTVDKVNILLDDIEGKSQSLNGLFDAIEKVGDTLSSANNKLTSFFTGFLKFIGVTVVPPSYLTITSHPPNPISINGSNISYNFTFFNRLFCSN